MLFDRTLQAIIVFHISGILAQSMKIELFPRPFFSINNKVYGRQIFRINALTID